MAGTVPFHSFFISVNVLDSSNFFVGGTLWANDCAFHMRPLAVAHRTWNCVVRLSTRRQTTSHNTGYGQREKNYSSQLSQRDHPFVLFQNVHCSSPHRIGSSARLQEEGS